MPNEVLNFLQLFFMAYIISIGFGMVVGQKRGAVGTHRFWVKLVTSSIKLVFRTIGDLFHLMGKKPKKKS